MSQSSLITQTETLRTFITANLSLDIEQMAQSEYLLDYVKDNLSRTNKIIFKTSINVEIQNLLTAAQTQLTNYNTNKNAAHFQTYLNQLANVIKIIPSPLRKGKDKQKDTLTSIALHAQALVDGLNTKSSELEKKISNLGDSVTQLQNKASETITETNEKIEGYAATFETTSNQKITDFLTEQEKKITTLVSTHEGIFANIATEKTSEMEVLSSSKDEEFKQLLTEQQNQLEEKQNEALKVLNLLRETLADSEFKLQGINENYGLSGEKVLTGTYASQKGIERTQANRWRITGFVLLCLSVILAVFLNIDVEKTNEGFKIAMREYNNGWQYFSKYGLVITLLLPGLLALREASAHRQRSSRYTQLEAQLAALDPFIQNFEFKEDFKSELKEAFFPGYATDTDKKKRKKRRRKSLFASLTKNSDEIDALKTALDDTKTALSDTKTELTEVTNSLSSALRKIEELTPEE